MSSARKRYVALGVDIVWTRGLIMAQRLTDAIAKRLPIPAKGNRIYYDTEVGGFGARITAAGARSYVLTYRVRGGRQRRYTIGSATEWQATAARDEAQPPQAACGSGWRSAGELEDDGGAATVADLCERFEGGASAAQAGIDAGGLPVLHQRSYPAGARPMKVADVTWSDVDALHRKITKAGQPYQANRAMRRSKMFSLAIRWHMRPDNPVKGIERNQEHKRKRYLSGAELARLPRRGADADRKRRTSSVAATDRLSLWRSHGRPVGGFRSGRRDVVKPGSTTKQRTDHITPLSAPARQLLAEIRRRSEGSPMGFPGPIAPPVTGSRSRKHGERSARPRNRRSAPSRSAAFVRQPAGERRGLAAADWRFARAQQPGHDTPLCAPFRRPAARSGRARRRRNQQRRKADQSGHVMSEPLRIWVIPPGYRSLRMCCRSLATTSLEIALCQGCGRRSNSMFTPVVSSLFGLRRGAHSPAASGSKMPEPIILLFPNRMVASN